METVISGISCQEASGTPEGTKEGGTSYHLRARHATSSDVGESGYLALTSHRITRDIVNKQTEAINVLVQRNENLDPRDLGRNILTSCDSGCEDNPLLTWEGIRARQRGQTYCQTHWQFTPS